MIYDFLVIMAKNLLHENTNWRHQLRLVFMVAVYVMCAKVRVIWCHGRLDFLTQTFFGRQLGVGSLRCFGLGSDLLFFTYLRGTLTFLRGWPVEFNNGRKLGEGQQLDAVEDNCRNPGESDPLTRIDFTGKVRLREDLLAPSPKSTTSVIRKSQWEFHCSRVA